MGGSGFHRVGQPAAALTEYGGIETLVTDGFDLDHQTGEIRPHGGSGDWDICVFQRWMHQRAAEITTLAQRTGQIIVQDVDDWYWGMATSNAAFDAAHPKTNPTVNWNHYRRALGKADLLTVSTPYLAERLKKFRVPIAVIPNMINLSLYTPDPVRDVEKPTVGWVGGVPWRSGDLEELKGILGPFMADHDLTFIHGGRAAHQRQTVAELFGLPKTVPLVERPMVPVDQYPGLFAGIDIFVAPLSDRPFNLSKCVDRETRVSTPQGIRPVAELGVGDKIWGGPGWKVVEAVDHQPRRAGFRITLDSGRQISVTPEHRLWVEATKDESISRFDREERSRGLRTEDYSYAQIAKMLRVSSEQSEASEQAEPIHGWHPVTDLRSGHCLLVEPWRFKETQQNIPVALLHGRIRSNMPQGGRSVPRIVIDETWGELLGAFAGDGSFGTTGIVQIHCDGRGGEVIEQDCRLFAEIGLHAKIGVDERAPHRKWVRVNSTLLQAVLVNLGLGIERLPRPGKTRATSCPERTPCVPEVIWRSPRPVVRAFLRGYFEADGTVSKVHAGISATSTDEALLRGVQLLLTGFGITSRLWNHPGSGKYWQLQLGREESRIFADKIGFTSHCKQDRLDQAQKRKPSGSTNNSRWVDPIVAIEPCSIDPVDIQIEGEQFIANGILSHNSNCKLLECSASGVPYVASHVGPYANYRGGGLTARRPKDWRPALTRLLDADVRRAQIGAQFAAVAAYDVAVRWADWLLVYETAGRLRTIRLAGVEKVLDYFEAEAARRGLTLPVTAGGGADR